MFSSIVYRRLVLSSFVSIFVQGIGPTLVWYILIFCVCLGTRYRPYLQADGQPSEHVPESALHQPPHHIPLRREALLLQEGLH